MRLGRIPWINAYPVYGAVDRGLVPVPAELVTGTASELNDLLAAGELDVSVVSAVEYARNAAAYHLLPDLAISCDGPVHSVALFSRRPVARSLSGAHIVLSNASACPDGSLVSIACWILPSGPTTNVSRLAYCALASSAAPYAIATFRSVSDSRR